MSDAPFAMTSYLFRSPARLDQARTALLQWVITHQADADMHAAFDQDGFLSHFPADGPVRSALDSLPVPPDTLGQALGFLRSSIHQSEQQWPPQESFETTLAAALTAQVQSRALASPSAPLSCNGPQPARPPRPKIGLMRRLVLMSLLALALWGGLRFAQNGLNRFALSQKTQAELPEYQTALSNLATSLPAYASVCLSMDRPCLAQNDRLLAESSALADLRQASESAGQILFTLGSLAPSDVNHWAVTPLGENCLAQSLPIQSDHQLVSGLCRTRERLGEYQLCLSGHPVLSDRQCRDLLRLATVDTVFDCDSCGARPANVFQQRLEWRRELTAAAQLGQQLAQIDSPLAILQATWDDLNGDWRAVMDFAATIQTSQPNR